MKTGLTVLSVIVGCLSVFAWSAKDFQSLVLFGMMAIYFATYAANAKDK